MCHHRSHNWSQDGHELQGEGSDQYLTNYVSDISKFSSTALSEFDIELINEEIEALNIQDETLSDVLELLRFVSSFLIFKNG